MGSRKTRQRLPPPTGPRPGMELRGQAFLGCVAGTRGAAGSASGKWDGAFMPSAILPVRCRTVSSLLWLLRPCSTSTFFTAVRCGKNGVLTSYPATAPPQNVTRVFLRIAARECARLFRVSQALNIAKVGTIVQLEGRRISSNRFPKRLQLAEEFA